MRRLVGRVVFGEGKVHRAIHGKGAQPPEVAHLRSSGNTPPRAPWDPAEVQSKSHREKLFSGMS